MRKLATVLGMVGATGLMLISGANAAPVPGYESYYDAVFASCSLPDGTLSACELAINAYAGVLVNNVDIDTANVSFSALRSEVFAANAADETFQADVDALFELLLPDSGAINPVDPSPTL